MCPPNLALDLDVAAGLLGESVDLRQAEAGALADFFGREERLEDLGELLRLDSRARVVTATRRTKSPRLPAWPRGCGIVDRALDPNVSAPSPSMASRAFTAMLTSAVSNWLASASSHGSQAISVTIGCAPTIVRSMSATERTRSADVEHLGLEGLPAGEGKKLSRELGGARSTVSESRPHTVGGAPRRGPAGAAGR